MSDHDHQSRPPADPDQRSTTLPRSRRRARTAVGAATTVALLAVTGTAAAATPSGFAGRGGPVLAGTITSVKGSVLGVRSTSGAKETVKVTATTTYEKTVTGNVSLLANGQKVTAIGTLSGRELEASRLAIGEVSGFGGFGGAMGGRGGAPSGGAPSGAASGGGRPAAAPEGGGTMPGGGGRAGGGAPGDLSGLTVVSGTVSALTKTSFLLTESNGTKGTVRVSSSTTVSDTTKISEAQLTVGQPVTVRGTTSKGSKAVTADAVVEGKVVAFGRFGGGFRGSPGDGGPGGPPAA